MALLSIPLTNFPDSEFSVELDKVIYLLRLTRNSRTERYALSISTENGDPIVMGIPLVVNYPLFDRFKDTRLPAGDIFLWDSTGKLREPTEETLGIEHLLLYQEAS